MDLFVNVLCDIQNKYVFPYVSICFSNKINPKLFQILLYVCQLELQISIRIELSVLDGQVPIDDLLHRDGLSTYTCNEHSLLRMDNSFLLRKHKTVIELR